MLFKWCWHSICWKQYHQVPWWAPPKKKTWVKNGQDMSMWRWGASELEIKQLGTAYCCQKKTEYERFVGQWLALLAMSDVHLPRWCCLILCMLDFTVHRNATSSPCNSQRPCKSRPEVSTGWKTRLDGHFLIGSGMCPRNLTRLRLPHLGWNEKSLTWPDYVQGPRA